MAGPLPLLDPKSKVTLSPHVVLIGAGASKAALPDGDWGGRQIPLMTDLSRVIGLDFLHGNVAVGVCIRDGQKGWIGHSCPKCSRPLKATPLLFPVRQKNYGQNPFIRNEWKLLRSRLREAYLVTLFGYSAPATDVVAKQTLLKAWRKNRTIELAEVEIIDVKSRRELIGTWRDFFCRNHFGLSRRFSSTWLFRHPRRSCESFAAATLLCEPWPENRFPRFKRLTRLQQWISPLLAEEDLWWVSSKP